METNKLLAAALMFFTSVLGIDGYADDYSWGAEFKQGDTISADTFNQIFNTIERLNRRVVDTDLVGTWTCDAMTTRETGFGGWIDKGSFYLLTGSQVNFTSSGSSSSSDVPYSVSTSSPSPFRKQSTGFNGTYQLYKNLLFVKTSEEPNQYGQPDQFARIYTIDFVSPTRFELVFEETSATSFPAQYSSFITCDSAVPTPSTPTNPELSQDSSGVTVSWLDNSEDEEGFKVYRRRFSEATAVIQGTVGADTTTYLDASVIEGMKYLYNVSAFNQQVESRKSASASITYDTIPPTVLSTSPSQGDLIAIDDRQVSILFSEPVEVYCPDGGQSGIYCNAEGGGITGSLTVRDGNRDQDRVVTAATTSSVGSGGSERINVTLIGGAELLAPNQTITLTINKEWIRDANGGNHLASDYVFSFDVGTTQNNPNCPPNC